MFTLIKPAPKNRILDPLVRALARTPRRRGESKYTVDSIFFQIKYNAHCELTKIHRTASHGCHLKQSEDARGPGFLRWLVSVRWLAKIEWCAFWHDFEVCLLGPFLQARGIILRRLFLANATGEGPCRIKSSSR